MKKQILKFRCQDCGSEFDAEQGSRKRFCEVCADKRIKAGKRIEDMGSSVK